MNTINDQWILNPMVFEVEQRRFDPSVLVEFL